MKRNPPHEMRLGLLAISLLLLLASPQAMASEGNISDTDKYAWSETSGWINFRPADGGVIVHATYLSGYAWGENIGWIKLGSDTGGPYANTNSTNWGVNRDASGNLSGYGWGTNVGWINFRPTHGGVTIDPGTGSFDGYAWSENTGWIHFKGTGGVAYNVAIRPEPVITSGDRVTFTVGHPGSFAVTATGYPTPTLSKTGALPMGITFNPATGILGGTPAPGTAGIYPLTFRAHNGVGADAVQDFTLTAAQTPGIMSENHATFIPGSFGLFTVKATGIPTPALGRSGALPDGVTFVDNGNGTATLSGTPAAGTTGSYALMFTAHNGADSDATQDFTLTVTLSAFTFSDDQGRAALCVDNLSGTWIYMVLKGLGSGNYSGTGRFTSRGNVLWLYGMDSGRWGINLVYNDKAKKAMATFGDRASGVRSSLIDTDTTDNPAGCD